MSKFRVQVKKNYCVKGSIVVEADDAWEAEAIVGGMIDDIELKTQDERIEWDSDYEYEDFSFDTTGEVDLEN